MVDTSAFIAALLPDEPGHDDYARFLERCALAGTVLAYCELVDLELAQAAINIYLRRRHGRRAANAARSDGRKLRPARAFASDLREAFDELLSGFDVVRVPISQTVHTAGEDGYWESVPLTRAAVSLVERFGIGSYDAAHVVCALVASAPMLTRDRDFARVPGLALITEQRKVAPARRLRRNQRHT